MSQMVTKCPKCATSFRVSEAQLQAAKGKVRCGSCLHVFRAEDHWLTPPAAAKPAAKAPAAKAPAPKAPPAKAPGKFAFDQDAIDRASAEKILTQPAVPAVNTQGEMRAIAARPKPGSILKDEDEDALISDGIDDADDGPAVKPVEGDDDYSDLFVNLGDLLDSDGDDFNTTNFETIDDDAVATAKAKGGKKAAEHADESWAKDLLEDIHDDSKEREAQVKSILAADVRDNVFADDGHVKKREGARDGFISGNRVNPEEDLGLNKPPPLTPLTRRDLLSKIEPAPVEIEWQGSRRDWLGMALWGSLSLLALAGLFVQYAWINFDNLAREQQYRPLYASVCRTLGCELPDIFNPAAIRSSNLVVRTDPAIRNVLVVDAILQNNATYSQPFPELELYFSDLDNFPVASRRFRPQEYLEGEMAGKTDMPPSRSIHISLQIVDPGDKAVNYRLEISHRKPVNS